MTSPHSDTGYTPYERPANPVSRREQQRRREHDAGIANIMQILSGDGDVERVEREKMLRK